MVFLVSMERKKTLNIPAEGFEFIISTFSGLILKLKSPSGTSFGLYFAYEEYCADDPNSLADWYNTSEMLQRYSTVRRRVCRNRTVRGFLAPTGPLFSSLCGLRVHRTSNFRGSRV